MDYSEKARKFAADTQAKLLEFFDEMKERYEESELDEKFDQFTDSVEKSFKDVKANIKAQANKEKVQETAENVRGQAADWAKKAGEKINEAGAAIKDAVSGDKADKDQA